MKTKERNRSIWMMAALLFLGATLYAFPGHDEELSDTINYKAYYGKVVDSKTNKALPFATIEALGSNAATVTNIDGEFIIKIERKSDVSQLKIAYIGFQNKILELDKLSDKGSYTVKLEQTAIQLKQVTIRPQDAMELIADVLANIRANYSDQPMMMRGFYRETIQRGRNYVSISEAIIDVYKGSYLNEYQVDQVKLFRGRKSADVERMDTVLFKVQGGPNTTILMDVVKNPYILLSEEYLNIYDFRLSDVITIDDRLHYVISFNQKEYVDDPYYKGRLYIEMDRLAISEAEFELNVENQDQAARLFIKRKPMGMSIIPERAAYRAKYTIEDDRWYFTYARAEVKFKVNWKKKFFNTTYSTMSELAITDRTYEGIEKFAGRERFKSNDILNEKVYIFFDQGFWGGYNVIEPDQSIQSAIRKLNKKYLKRTADV
ncbi:MAG: carboxypeptidase-like regulatory domain-containing protein [Bacteroidetes bacterium]|nr:MAG: carboxypeptidase-like regulatory domain-containing protein [Bacteroidota bacterium]RLD72169.1 MAG: carboxypeptidase-like regulatory domain-containing protein [Bacteroidota bacterium]RLD93999.1 MAG: carboxypeptidase-like regulatory domain-containing protein [Bacteroidota bacterium]